MYTDTHVQSHKYTHNKDTLIHIIYKQIYTCTNTEMSRYTNLRTHTYKHIQLYRYTHTEIHKYTCTHIYESTNVPIRKFSKKQKPF